MLENCAILRQRADRAGAVQRKKTPLYNIAAAKPPGTDAGGKNVPYTFTNIHQHPSISETRLAAVCSTKRSSGIPFRKGSLPPSLSTYPAPTLHADSLLAHPTLQHILLYIYTYFYITPFCLYNAILCCTTALKTRHLCPHSRWAARLAPTSSTHPPWFVSTSSHPATMKMDSINRRRSSAALFKHRFQRHPTDGVSKKETKVSGGGGKQKLSHTLQARCTLQRKKREIS